MKASIHRAVLGVLILSSAGSSFSADREPRVSFNLVSMNQSETLIVACFDPKYGEPQVTAAYFQADKADAPFSLAVDLRVLTETGQSSVSLREGEIILRGELWFLFPETASSEGQFEVYELSEVRGHAKRRRLSSFGHSTFCNDAGAVPANRLVKNSNPLI